MKSITVFCGSSDGNDGSISHDAQYLGKKLAYEKITLVYGAAKIGIMGKVAQACLENRGKVIGVIPEFLKLKEVVHLGLSETITTETMHQRKQLMNDLADGFIALPGGFGTLEELFEVLTWAQLGLHQKPVGLLNSNGFYDDLKKMFEKMISKGLLKEENMNLIIIANNVDSLLEKMKNFKPIPTPKWLMANR